jgi:type III pantothenate kinase
VYLLIDIGNSAVKWVISPEDKFKVIEKKSFPVSDKRWLSKLKTDYQKYHPKKVVFASVKPSLDTAIKQIIPSAVKVKLDFLETLIGVDYETKTTLGIDRILNALGGLNYADTFVVVSLGTATVVDLTLNKTFKGGLIFCGIHKQLECLTRQTELIRNIETSTKLPLVGKSTSQAVWGGIIYSTLYGIKGIAETLKEIYSTETLIVTGGNLKLVKDYIKEIFQQWKLILDEEIAFRGLFKVTASLND